MEAPKNGSVLRAGSGFISSDYYLHGFFSASIKLPRDYTAGVVVAFYVSVPVSTPLLPVHYFLFDHRHSYPKQRFFTPALTRPAGVVAGVLSSRWLLPLAWSRGRVSADWIQQLLRLKPARHCKLRFAPMPCHLCQQRASSSASHMGCCLRLWCSCCTHPGINRVWIRDY
jgi:hypothetical protein